MKIAFNLIQCGLGNNGGSQSIIRMAMALSELGNEVKILLDSPNKFTWFGGFENLLHLVNKKNKDSWPKYDVIIATGCKTVNSTLEYPNIDINNKFYWIRGHETWGMSEEDLFKNYKSGLNLLVNSEWLREMIFRKCEVISKIQYPGYVDGMHIAKAHGFVDEINIGALYYADKESKMFNQIINIAFLLKENKIINKLILFGNKQMDDNFKRDLNDLFGIPYEFSYRPTYDEKMALMNKCDIWLSTSELEGLHIPPIEAGLNGCNLVTKGLYSSGTSDYAIDGLTAKIFFTAEEALQRILEYVNDPKEMNIHSTNLRYILYYKIGSVQNNALKFQKILKSSLEK